MRNRREILKQYAMTLIAEGYLDPRDGKNVMRKLLEAVRDDAQAVLGEVADFVARSAADHYVDKVGGRVKEAIGEAMNHGVKAAWRNLMKDYWRGVDAEARGGKR